MATCLVPVSAPCVRTHTSLVIALCTCACVSAPRATPPGHTFGGVLRIPVETVREDLLVPQAHTGSGLGFSLSYAGAFAGGVMRADLGVGARYLRAAHDAQALIFDHSLRLRHAFTVAAGAWHVGVGPAFGWETDIAYFETWDDAHAYWLTDRWLGPTVTAWTRLDPCWRVDLEGELMLVALESRRPRAPDYKQDGLDAFSFYFAEPQRYRRFAWLADTQRLRLAADFWRSRSDGPLPNGWALGAETRVVHASYPASLLVLELALRFTAVWSFP